MFTGVVEELGVVEAVRDADGGRALDVGASLAGRLVLGQSVAVDGACLTVRALGSGSFAVDLGASTLERTIASRYAPGAPVNLERAAKIGDRLDGHVVQGHVDARGRLDHVRREGATRFLALRLPAAVVADMVPRGSVALNGVGMTVNRLEDPGFCEVAVIPYTWEHTNLSALRPGDPVNVETDLIGKYVRRMVEGRTVPSQLAGHGA